MGKTGSVSVDIVHKDTSHIADMMRSMADMLDKYSNNDNTPSKVPTSSMKINKINDEQQLVFGWASMSTDTNGHYIVDSDSEVIDPVELEKAAYDYVLEAREAGQLHKGDSVGRIVESLVMTPEKAKAMGLDVGNMHGWWIGVKVEDPEVFAKVKDGTYKMFSIQGTATREDIQT